MDARLAVNVVENFRRSNNLPSLQDAIQVMERNVRVLYGEQREAFRVVFSVFQRYA